MRRIFATSTARRSRARRIRQSVCAVGAALAVMMLCGCTARGDRALEEFAQLRAEQAAATRLVTVARVSADYGERVFEFRLQYSGTCEAGELEILAPQSLEGVTARVSGNAATVRYDGAELNTGSLGDGLSAAGIVPRLIVEWQSGFADSLTLVRNGAGVGRREELIMQSVLVGASEQSGGTEGGVRQTTRFDAETRIPIRTEVVRDGRVVLTVRYESFVLE